MTSSVDVETGAAAKAVVDLERGIMALGGELHSDSMINVRPSHGNRSRGVEDAGLRAAIERVVSALVKPE